MQKRAIIFDFFGVIAVEVRSALIAAYARNDAATEEIHRAFELADTGYMSRADLYERCAVATGKKPADIEQFIHVAAVIDTQMVSYIRHLHRTHRIALCSNAPHGVVESLMDHYHFLDCFDEVCVSSALHITKPDPRIFSIVLARLNCNPEDVVFIDDNSKNVAAAESLGITGILHTGREATCALLKSHGISTS